MPGGAWAPGLDSRAGAILGSMGSLGCGELQGACPGGGGSCLAGPLLSTNLFKQPLRLAYAVASKIHHREPTFVSNPCDRPCVSVMSAL